MSEDRYRDLVEHSHDLICTHDLTGRILSVNQTAARAFGVKPERLIGQDIREGLLPEYRAEFDNYLAEIQQTGGAHGLMAIRTKAGEKRIWEYTNTLRTEGVAAPIVRGLAHDVTEQKRAETELRFRKSLLESQTEASIDGILVVSAQGEILSFNKRLVELWHIPEAVLSTRSDKAALEYVLDQLADPQEFLTRVEYLYEHAEQESRDEVSLKDGRILDRYSAPIKSTKNEYYGRVWFFRDITERKRAEEMLRETAKSKAESLALLDTILASAPIGFAFHNRALVFERINDTLAAINGLPVEEHLGHTLREILPEMAAHVEPTFERVLTTGEPVLNVELSGTTPADPEGLHYWLASFYPVRTRDGEVLGVGVLVLEITERKRALEALRESEKRYRLLFEANPHPMWVYDLETLRFLAVNAAAVRHYGYTREEFLALTIKDIRPPEDIPALLEKVANVRGGLDEAGVWRHRKKDGSLIDVEITAHELLFAGRRAEVVLANDVTERRRVEAALRHAEEKYRSIFEHAVEGIFQSTPDGHFISVNPALARILGYASPEELIAERTDIGTQHYVDATCRAELLQMLTERDVVVGFECEVYRKDRSKIWVVENVRVIRDEGGTLRYYEGSIEDIQERKTLEAQFRQAQRLEAVGQLAGGVAHDFNNLLTAITGYSDLALRQLRPEDPLHRNLDEIRKAAERAAGLTRQLLAFSRKQVLQPKVINLNATVSEIEKMLRRLIGEDIDLLTVLKAEPGAVKADPGQIEQVLMNLAVNARDAMPHGGRLTIETANVNLNAEYVSQHIGVAPGPYVMLAISDTGTGMYAATQAQIFEPFFTTKDMWNDRDIPLAYLITFRCYGTWLHGDERGSVDRHHNRYQSPYMPPNEQRRQHNTQKLKGAPVTLDAACREAVDKAIHETCILRQWLLRAINVRTNHVHIVVSIGDTKPERALNAFKANATRQMRQAGCWAQAYSPWVDKGSRRYLWNERSIEHAIDYVINGQGDELPDFD